MSPSPFFKRPVAAGIAAALLLTAGFVGGVYAGSNSGERSFFVGLAGVGASAAQPSDVDFAPLWRAWNALNDRFVPASSTDAVSKQDQLFGAIQGLADSFGDPYTVFLPPEDAEVFEEDISGNFEGVGMEIGIRDEMLTVISPLEGSPAEAAGIRSGDAILEIDGTSTAEMTIDRAVKLIRGERGTEVVLTVRHDDEEEPVEIAVVRDVIEIPTIDTELREDGVFVIELHNFSAVSPDLFREALREFVETDSTDLVLDLRGNPGGFLQAAVSMASWFLPAGDAVVVEDFGDGKQNIHRSRGFDAFASGGLDMAILVNQGTASASEILAGALSEHGVATLVGEQTFGKGSVQELVDITDDSFLKVTIARWLTPQGKSISASGLTPDVVVEISQEDIEAGRDPQLEKAAEIVLNQ